MTSGFPPPAPEITLITPEALKTRLDAGEYLCLIDQRDFGAFDTAHIPGARWCSYRLLERQITQAAPTTYIPLVLYCSRGEESGLSVSTLQHLGYAHVFVVQGGFMAWCAAGFPTEAGGSVE